MSSQPIDTMSLPSEALGMGNPSAEYRARAVMPWVSAAFMGIFGLGFALLAALALIDDSGNVTMLCVFGALGVGLLVAAVFQTVNAFNNRNLRVVVLDKGLVRTAGDKTDIIRWDDIASVLQAVTVHYTNGIKTRTTHVYTINQTNGSKIVFNDTLKNVEALGNTIQKEASSRLLPKYAEAYNSGGTVTFGKLTLSKAGISNGKETIGWDQVQAVNINQGQINVRKQGKWLNWAGQTAAATPNLYVFLALVDQIVGVNQKRR